MRNIKGFVISFSSAILLWACSAETGAPPIGNGNDKITDSKDSTKKAPASSTTASAAPAPSSTAAGPAPASSSSAAATGATGADAPPTACEQACITKFPNGSKQSQELEDKWYECICQPSACATQCGQSEECADNGPKVVENDACSQCEASAAAKPCDDQQTAACTGECASFKSCMDACDGGKDD